MIELKNITKCYMKDNKKVLVLNNVNYKFYSGKLYCIVGKSGAGKSTLIQMIGLLLNPTNGEIIYNKALISSMKNDRKSDFRNNEIGFIFQSFYLNPLMNVYENILLPCFINKKHSIKEYKIRSYELIDILELKGREKHYPNELSGGEQQRVAIARALINEPSIILADEPTGSLDPENEKKILNILKKLSKEGKCVIIVSHSENVKKYADKVLLIKNKQLLEMGSLDD